MRFVHSTLALAALVVAPAAAPAQLLYAWGDLSGNLVSSATVVGTGNSITLRVYAQDASAGATVFNSQGGLGSASVRVTGVTGSASVISGLPDVGSTGWENGDTNGSNPPANVALNLFNINAGRLPDTTGRVLLGTVTLRGDALGTFTVTAADPFPANSGDVTLFGNGQSLDPLSPAQLQFMVIPVPEPTGLLAAGVTGILIAIGRRKYVCVRRTPFFKLMIPSGHLGPLGSHDHGEA